MPQGIKLFATCPRFAEIGQFLKKMDRLVLRFRRTEPGAALIYATTRHQNSTLWTQDADFKDLPHVRYFPKIQS